MLLLAIDTSGKQGSIALARAEGMKSPDRTSDDLNNDELEIIEIAPLAGGTFSAQLIPQIATLLSSNGFDKSAIEAFAVVTGPGSFTGLRVGLAAVKALAEVLNKPIAPVSLLAVCADMSGTAGKIMPVLDAGRGDVYVGEYEIPAKSGTSANNNDMPRESIMTRGEFLSHAQGRTIVTPDSVLADAVRQAGVQVTTLSPISAADVARLGWKKIRAGETVTPEQLEANYIRRTDAELLEKSRT
jgi:tRNA threonylcarbamoyladenosine biosynthesis protein TsaB